MIEMLKMVHNINDCRKHLYGNVIHIAGNHTCLITPNQFCRVFIYNKYDAVQQVV